MLAASCDDEGMGGPPEVHQQVGSWISQRTRLARGARHVEITYTVSCSAAHRARNSYHEQLISSHITTRLHL